MTKRGLLTTFPTISLSHITSDSLMVVFDEERIPVDQEFEFVQAGEAATIEVSESRSGSNSTFDFEMIEVFDCSSQG